MIVIDLDYNGDSEQHYHWTFLFPKAALLWISTNNCNLCPDLIFWAHKEFFVFLANQICQICSEHAQRERKSVNCRLLVLDIPRGHDSWCWLTSLQVNRYNFWRLKCQKLRLFCRLVADQKECGLWGREWRRWQFILCQHWKDSYAFLL